MSASHFVTRRVAFFIAPPSIKRITDTSWPSSVYSRPSLYGIRSHREPASTSQTLQFISPKKGGKNSMSETSTLIGYSGRTIGREELTLVPTPAATETHRPIPHHEIVQALIETLGFRHIGVEHDEYAVSPDGMKMFGVLDLATEMQGCRFSIGV